MPPFLSMQDKINELAKLKDGWGSYNEGVAPDGIAIGNAKRVLCILEEMNFPATNVTPSIDGGITFVFYKNKRYADIECFNSDVIAAIISDHSTNELISAWEVTNIKETVERIEKFLNENNRN